MRVAALYDIHGNLPALEAALAEIAAARVDRIVVGGDVVAGPMPRETLRCLLDLEIPVRFLRGNADREVAAAMAGEPISDLPEHVAEIVRWVARQLDPEQGRLLANWPQTLTLDIERLGAVLFCHATPRSDSDVFTRITPTERLPPGLSEVEASLLVCGHTHMQFERPVGELRIVNAGSVGMPYGEPGAHWLLLGPEVHFRRTGYDRPRAAERILDTHYPQAREFAARNVLQTPTEAEALAVFEEMAAEQHQR